MDIEEADIDKWLPKDYCTDELTHVIFEGPYERIELAAYELDTMDDEGTIPARGLMIGDVSVTIKGNSPDSKVVFADGKGSFTLSLNRMYSFANVHTVFDVIDFLYLFKSGRRWTLQELKEYFSANFDDVLLFVHERLYRLKDKYGMPRIKSVLALCAQDIPEHHKIVGMLCMIPEWLCGEFPLYTPKLETAMHVTKLSMYQLYMKVVNDETIALWQATVPSAKTTIQKFTQELIRSGNREAIAIRAAVTRALLSVHPKRNDKDGRALCQALEMFEDALNQAL